VLILVTESDRSTPCVTLLKVDLLYMQNLRSIAEIQESGVTAENFHEVSGYCLISHHLCLVFFFLFSSFILPIYEYISSFDLLTSWIEDSFLDLVGQHLGK